MGPHSKGGKENWLAYRVVGLSFCGCFKAFWCAVLCMGLAGCGLSGASARPLEGETDGPAFNRPALVEPVFRAQKATGFSGAFIDASSVAQGYVVASAENPDRLKFRVVKDGEAYSYDFPDDGKPLICPFTRGNGVYEFGIWRNTEGSRYALVTDARADVQLESEFAPFLVPSVYCSFDADSACVAKANELAEGARNEGEVLERVCSWIVGAINYDKEKAAQLADATGYLPNPDQTLEQGKGVCFDYASLGAAMLRSQGIPCKILTGYVSPNNVYHAWIEVYISGSWRGDWASVNPNEWTRLDLTFAAAGGSELAGDGKTYEDRFIY